MPYLQAFSVSRLENPRQRTRQPSDNHLGNRPPSSGDPLLRKFQLAAFFLGQFHKSILVAGQFVAGNVPFPAPLSAISGKHPRIGERFPARHHRIHDLVDIVQLPPFRLVIGVAQRLLKELFGADHAAGVVFQKALYLPSLTTTSGDVTLKVPKLKGISFETAIIERYRRRESSVEEALIEMYLAGVSVRRVEDITEALWGSKVSPSTISELNKKAYVHIEDWRNRPLQGGRYPYVYVDGIYLRRNWGGEFENVAILVAIAVNEDGYREVLGAAEGMKEDKSSWVSFFQWLRGRGLDGAKLIVGDKCLGMLEAVGEVFPEAKYQRCTVHFYRNVFSVTPRSKVKLVAKMLKAIHAQESKKAAREKAKAVVEELRSMKLKEAAKKVEDGIEETLTYCDFPSEHWTRIRTNNVIERLNREIRRRTRVVGSFPDGNSALMLVCARLRHVAGTQWGNKKYMNMKHLEAALEDASIAG